MAVVNGPGSVLILGVTAEDAPVEPEWDFALAIQDRMLHPERYAPFIGLNIGSGNAYCPLPGWVNIDTNVLPGWKVDLVASALDLPYEDESVDRVYFGHTLEHLRIEDVPTALTEANRVLRKRGEVCVVGPALDYAQGHNAPQWLIDDISEHIGCDDGLGHYWTPTSTLTLELVRSVFPSAEFLPLAESRFRCNWPNQDWFEPIPRNWQVAVKAAKGSP